MHSENVNRCFLIAFIIGFLIATSGCGKEETSKPELDETPPLVVSATGIDLHHVEVVFNEKVQETSAENVPNYAITRSGGIEIIEVLSIVLLSDGKTVSLETSSQSSFSYILSVTAVKDLAGNAMGTQTLTFDGNSELDTTAPVVASTHPESDEHGVDTTATVVVEFSEKMNRTSVQSNFYLERASDGGNLPGSFAWEANDTRFVFTPTSHLYNYARYYAAISTGATDAVGNSLGSPYIWGFVTGNGGAISGTITYTGMPPYDRVMIGVFRNACLTDQVGAGIIETPGSYTIDPVPPGTCYVGAFMDANGSENPDIGEPAGIYDPNGDGIPDSINVSTGRTRAGVDFELEYEFQLSTISGTVSKSPDVTQSDTTYVAFFMSDPTNGGGDPVDVQVLPSGTGAYSSLPLEFGCYYVICYMDVNHNRELDTDGGGTPIEPVGLYGQIVQGEPVLTPILLIVDAVGINMTLFYFTGSPAPPLVFSHLKGASISRDRARKSVLTERILDKSFK